MISQRISRSIPAFFIRGYEDTSGIFFIKHVFDHFADFFLEKIAPIPGFPVIPFRRTEITPPGPVMGTRTE
jgi:hypothetical protein